MVEKEGHVAAQSPNRRHADVCSAVHACSCLHPLTAITITTSKYSAAKWFWLPSIVWAWINTSSLDLATLIIVISRQSR